MLKEYHYDHLIRWPNGERAAVFHLRFPGRRGRQAGQERHPELRDVEPGRVQAAPRDLSPAHPQGREHQGDDSHLWRHRRAFSEAVRRSSRTATWSRARLNHEIARYLPRDQEHGVMRKAIAMIQQRTGVPTAGARAQSTNTIELLIEHGFVFNTSCFHEELPFRGRRTASSCRARAQPFGDGTLFGHRHGSTAIRTTGWLRPGRPISRSSIRRAARSGQVHPLHDASLHHWRPGRTRSAARHHPAHAQGVGRKSRFPTGIELAEWCLDTCFRPRPEAGRTRRDSDQGATSQRSTRASPCYGAGETRA